LHGKGGETTNGSHVIILARSVFLSWDFPQDSIRKDRCFHVLELGRYGEGRSAGIVIR